MFEFGFNGFSSFSVIFYVMFALVIGIFQALAAAVLLLLNEENLGRFQRDNLQLYVSIGLFALAFVATYYLKIGPIKVILLAGLFGGLFYSLV